MLHSQRANVYFKIQKSCKVVLRFSDEHVGVHICDVDISPETQQCESFISVLNFKNKRVLFCECNKIISLV